MDEVEILPHYFLIITMSKKHKCLIIFAIDDNKMLCFFTFIKRKLQLILFLLVEKTKLINSYFQITEYIYCMIFNIKNKLIKLFLLCFSFFSLHAIAQNNIGNVISFNKKNYHGARQNWGLSTKHDGTVFFANHQGLLCFDGTNWKLNHLPNESFLRAVKVKDDSTVYTSGYMEFGYWKTNNLGELKYFSLAQKANKYLANNIEFWNIIISGNYVYFQSFSKILTYVNDTVVPVDISGTINVMSKVNSKVLVAIRDKGIFEINGTSVSPFIVDKVIRNKQIKFIIPYKKNQLLIGTAASGIFLWDGKKIEQWNKTWTDYFIENELNRGCITKDNKIIIGTIINGIVIFDLEGNLLSKINMHNGLPDNTVLGIETDEWQNIWLALDNGIAFISHTYPKSYTIQKIKGTGAIYSAALLNNDIYLGTNHGVFVKNIKSESEKTTMIPKTQGQTWDCKIINNKLWVGHNEGTFVVEKNNAKLLSSQSGGFAIRPDILNKNLLIQCTYNSLVTYKKQGNSYAYNGLINGFSDLIRYIEIDYHGNIWVSHMHKGVYKIITNARRDSVIRAIKYGGNIFGKENSVHVFKVENRIVFTTNEKLYTYDDLNDSIIPFKSLNSVIGKFQEAHRIIAAPNHYYWFIRRNSIGLFHIFQEDGHLIKEYPLALFDNLAMVDNYENILPINDKKAILCLQDGIAWLDASINDSLNTITKYNPVIRKLELFSDNNKIKRLALNSNNIRIKNTFHNIYFKFSFPLINDKPISYRYCLNGLDFDWNEIGNVPELSFDRLSQGKYTLKVKAVDLWGNESNVYKFSFEILPPWYSSNVAISLYSIIFIVMLLLFHYWGTMQTKKKEQQQHEKREQELIRLRNEKLRDEIKYKSKELANSTMSIIKKNEFLLNLKEIIDKQKTELGSRYPDKYYNYLNKKIDENISNQDDWKIFQTNFEQAHEQFLIKIKENYPELTSGDLRLCAYLRMNLTSKEIAPLLGISVRGVENHRFRLRKKFNLNRDESLSDIILSF